MVSVDGVKVILKKKKKVSGPVPAPSGGRVRAGLPRGLGPIRCAHARSPLSAGPQRRVTAFRDPASGRQEGAREQPLAFVPLAAAGPPSGV